MLSDDKQKTHRRNNIYMIVRTMISSLTCDVNTVCFVHSVYVGKTSSFM